MNDYHAEVSPLMTCAEVADLFKVTVGTVRRYANAGKLGRFLRPGGSEYRFYRFHVTHAYLGGTFDKDGNPSL